MRIKLSLLKTNYIHSFLKKLGTRERAILSSLLVSIFLFLAASPLVRIVLDVVTPPSEVQNIEVTAKKNSIDLKWSRAKESDFGSYIINITPGDTKSVEVSVDNYSFTGLDGGKLYKIDIFSKDKTGFTSNPISFSVPLTDKTLAVKINEVDKLAENTAWVVTTAITVALILLLLNLWVLFFNIDRVGLFTIAGFPSVAILPFLVFSLTYLNTLNSLYTKAAFTSVLAIVNFGLVYFLILTANILNGARQKRLPLEQAAKASHFILSLVSVYLSLIYVFASNFNLVVKVLVVQGFMFYFSFSGLIFVSNLAKNFVQKAVLKAAAISLIILTAIFILAIWPVQPVYIVLAVAILYYILLNIAIEVRAVLDKYIYFEYGALIILILIILMTSGGWGINGTLL